MAAAVPPLGREEQAFAGNVEGPSVGGPSATTPDGAPADPGAAGPEGTAPGAADPGGTGGGTTGGTGGEQSPNAGVAPCTDRTLQVPGDPYSPPCYAFSGDNGGATHQGDRKSTRLNSSH